MDEKSYSAILDKFRAVNAGGRIQDAETLVGGRG